jgi:hypothetical protein
MDWADTAGRVNGGGRSLLRTALRPNSLLTGKITGNSEVFGSRSRMALHGILHNSLCLARRCRPSRLKKNREFFQDIRELKFPDTGSSSESLLFFW